MSRRIAFVVNALTGSDLQGGKNDVDKVSSILRDNNLGLCDEVIPLKDCESKTVFEKNLLTTFNKLTEEDQLIFYFSGHGKENNGHYCLLFGRDSETYIPFDYIQMLMQISSIRKAIIILDCCYSGKVLDAKDSSESLNSLENIEIGDGLAIIASSEGGQRSFETDDKYYSIFTKLFCDGIESGLDGKKTQNGYITPSDIVSYINKNRKDKWKTKIQIASYGISQTKDAIWISKNASGTTESSSQKNKIKSIVNIDHDLLQYFGHNHEATAP